MKHDAAVARGREAALQHFRWIDGHADTWNTLNSGASLVAVVRGLAALVKGDIPHIVAGIEARGFALGLGVALELGVGFAPIRKQGSLFPGDLLHEMTSADYRGNQHLLTGRRDLFGVGQRVVLMDDWIETGSQALAAAKIIEASGSTLVAIAVIVDQADDQSRANLPPIRALLEPHELPGPNV